VLENYKRTKLMQGQREYSTIYLHLFEVHLVASRPDMDEVAAKLPTFKFSEHLSIKKKHKWLSLMPNKAVISIQLPNPLLCILQ